MKLLIRRSDNELWGKTGCQKLKILDCNVAAKVEHAALRNILPIVHIYIV